MFGSFRAKGWFSGLVAIVSFVGVMCLLFWSTSVAWLACTVGGGVSLRLLTFGMGSCMVVSRGDLPFSNTVRVLGLGKRRDVKGGDNGYQ